MRACSAEWPVWSSHRWLKKTAEPSERADHASVGIVSTTRRTSCECRAYSELCSADAIA